MDFDAAKAFERVRHVVWSAASVKAGMDDLLGYCRAQSPNPVWAIIRQLDFERDVAALRMWLEVLIITEPPPDNISGLWFGLFYPVLSDGRTGCDLYLSGSPRFDPDDSYANWACWRRDSYIPESKNSSSGVLREMYLLLEGSGVATLGRYVLCLGYACLAAKSIWGCPDGSLLRGPRGPRGIAVGFDEGDFIILPSGDTPTS